MISEPNGQCGEQAEPAGAHAEGIHRRPGADGTHPLDSLFKHLAEAREYALLYIETRKDQLRAAVRTGLLYAGLALLALVVGATVLVAATVLFFAGIAKGLGLLLGGHQWAGEVITGAIVLMAAGLGAWLLARGVTRKFSRQMAEKYERRRFEIQDRFGRQPPVQPVDSQI